MAFNWREYDRFEEASMRLKARRRRSEGEKPGAELYTALAAVIAVPVLIFILRFRPNLLHFSGIGSRSFIDGAAVGILIGLALYSRRRNTVREEKQETAGTEEFASAQRRVR